MISLAANLTAVQLAATATFGEGERAGRAILQEMKIAETTIEHELWTRGAHGAEVTVRPASRPELYYVCLITPARSVELLSTDFDSVLEHMPQRFTLLQLFNSLLQCDGAICK